MSIPNDWFSTDEQGRLDPYRLVHKGIRVKLARLLESAGRTDFADPRACERFRSDSLETVHLLRTHARLEGLFLDPLLAQLTSEEGGSARQDHAQLESTLFKLVLDLDRPSESGASPAEARAHGHRFYLALTRLVAQYLLHMAEEETRLLALLHAHVKVDVLRETVTAAQSTMSPSEAAKTTAAIAEGIAPHEREAIFGPTVSPRRERPRSRPSMRPGSIGRGVDAPNRDRSNRHV